MQQLDIKYIATKNKNETVEINGFLLHSKYDPIKEAQRIADKEYIENYVHVLFGYGLGYVADALGEKLNGKESIVIVDPFKEELNIENEFVQSMGDVDKIKSKLSNLLENNSREVKVICSPNYDKLAVVEYKNLLQIVKDVQREKEVDENTIRFGSENWQENYIKNLLFASKDLSLGNLEKKYDCPVVIASGGPSLTKQIPQLKKIRENIILIAAGSTVNSLVKDNIEPDYVVTIDGTIANYNHFKDLKLKEATLLYCLSSHYGIQQEYAGQRYAFLTTNDFRVGGHMKKNLHIDLPYIAGGGSVANFAFTIAMFISSGPIALIGQDLAYTNNQTHALNNKHFEMINEEYLQTRDAFEVEGYFGDKVKTDYVLYSMKQAFECLHEAIEHESPIYNCTEGGVKLIGFEQIPFEEFIVKHVKPITINKIGSSNADQKVPISKLIEQLYNEVEIYSKLEKSFLDALSLLKVNKKLGFFKHTVLTKLDKIDKKTKESLELVMMDRIVEPLTMDVLRNYKPKKNETPKESFERVYNQSVELYSRLLEVTKKSKRFSNETIELVKLYEVKENGRTN